MKFFFANERTRREGTTTSREKLPQSCYHYFLNLRTIRERFCGLTTQYRANFLGIFVVAARRLGSLIDEPSSHQATSCWKGDCAHYMKMQNFTYFTKNVNWCRHLFLANFLILLFLCGSLNYITHFSDFSAVHKMYTH